MKEKEENKNLMRQLKNYMMEITRQAGLLAKELSNNYGKVIIKSHKLDLVTEADRKVNELLLEYIQASFPEHGIISEELGEHQTDAKYVWIIDPIDGTLNYFKKIPCYGVIIALQIDSEIEMSCVYDPSSGDMYFAQRGEGAFLNGSPIKCSTHTMLEHSVGLTNDSVNSERIDFLNQINNTTIDGKAWASSNGCTAVSCGWVASGRKDWYCNSGNGKIWDYAGTVLLLRESGCSVVNLSGEEWKYGDGAFIAANPSMTEKLLKLTQKKPEQEFITVKKPIKSKFKSTTPNLALPSPF